MAVEISNDEVRAREFYEGYGYTIPAAFDVRGEVSRRFGVIATPMNYLLDREGRVVWRHYGYRPGDEATMRAEIAAELAR